MCYQKKLKENEVSSMNSKFKITNIFVTFLMIICLGLSIPFLNTYSESFVQICKISVGFVFASVILCIIAKRKIFTPSIIILAMFVLFQFGMPILKAFDENFYSWYLTQFSEDELIFCTKYSAFCIEFYSLGLILMSFNSKRICHKKSNLLSNENGATALKAGRFLFIISGIIAIPFAIYNAYLAFKYGYNYIKVDTAGISNGLTNFATALFVPSAILMWVYGKSRFERKIPIIILVFYSLVLIFTGARTSALAVILVLLYCYIKSNRNIFLSKVMIGVGTVVILLASVWIAEFRFDGKIDSNGLFGVLESLIEEMGFNFTSICFTKHFVPEVENYRYGLSYFYSIICLFPKSLDFTGAVSYSFNELPEIWLGNTLHNAYGTTYDFGVGFSVIAESYFNFGEFGWILVLIQSLIINWLIDDNEYYNNSLFGKYIQLVMLYSLITYPRRSINTLFKTIEYSIILVIIIIWILNNLKYKAYGREYGDTQHE